MLGFALDGPRDRQVHREIEHPLIRSLRNDRPPDVETERARVHLGHAEPVVNFVADVSPGDGRVAFHGSTGHGPPPARYPQAHTTGSVVLMGADPLRASWDAPCEIVPRPSVGRRHHRYSMQDGPLWLHEDTHKGSPFRKPSGRPFARTVLEQGYYTKEHFGQCGEPRFRSPLRVHLLVLRAVRIVTRGWHCGCKSSQT